MEKRLLLLSISIFFCLAGVSGQSRYEAKITDFSSPNYDEFSPVLYNEGIVFCTNQKHELLISYQNELRKGLFNIFKIERIDSVNYGSPEIFSRNLVTPLNDGPLAFSPDSKRVVFSRNIHTKVRRKNIVDPDNVLGLFFAELGGEEWINIEAFEFNGTDYSITAPCFSPDGMYLYFASNMPGGLGGSDLYRSKLHDGSWSKPENLGNTINTAGNEVFPFFTENDQFFFASDGHGGLGMKDIYLTRYDNSGWAVPIRLDPPINSPADDFGIYTSGDFSSGYFSSNRGASDDIYHFYTIVPQLTSCDTMQENLYCFEFWDEQAPEIDTLPVFYEWEFSDGSKVEGLVVEHCFPGAGKYWAKLNIIDNSTDSTYTTQTSMEFELVDHIQPFITCCDTMTVNSPESFSGANSFLPGFTVEKYIWEFGDDSFVTGIEANHMYEEPGTYYVKLGLMGTSAGGNNKEIKCAIKQIHVVSDTY